jgi:glycosyltransferase involved in cell wall biosynthesis
MKGMRIGYFVGRFPYSISLPNYRYGGGEVVAYNLAINMAKRGHAVHIFTTSANGKDLTEKKEGLIIHRYGTIAQVFERNLSLGLLYKPLMHEVDIVHVHVGSSPLELIASLIYAKMKKKPLIATYHGDVIPSLRGFTYRSSVHIYNSVVERLLNHARIIISPSKCYINESIFLKGHADKVVVIPNGINIEDFNVPYSKEECRERLGLPHDKKLILFLGVLHPKKGPHVLIKAMPWVISKVPDTELLVAGDGVMRDYLKVLVNKLGISQHVRFVGFVEESLKPLYYKAVDVFCLPSITITESFGIVNLEAMACGVPIVASKVGGIPDVVKDGENGLLVPPKDLSALAHAIIRLLEDEELRKRIGEKAKKEAEKYSWKKIAEMMEKLYEHVLGE